MKNDKFLISTGGADKTNIIWRVIDSNDDDSDDDDDFVHLKEEEEEND